MNNVNDQAMNECPEMNLLRRFSQFAKSVNRSSFAYDFFLQTGFKH